MVYQVNNCFMVYQHILAARSEKLLAVLVDPDKHTPESLMQLADVLCATPVDFVFVGGSLVAGRPDQVVDLLKESVKKPVVLFPGSLLQISPNADAVLLLSLISGRNPEFLIGNHVVAAPFLKKSHIEVIPTGYILIENGFTSSVEYMSNTKPLPARKPDIAVATAMAGEMLGMKLIYLEGGSGASHPLPSHLIQQVKDNISIPLVVGGGIRTSDDLQMVAEAGADLIVIGNALENNTDRIYSILSEWPFKKKNN
ncbi:MAG: geranylgeranylglyceryl/heptaprenylglyceryl phosphate synthase [Bacteroidales bacterium]|nr:geranylgeranylglyceryl/heptaprenylglyceryl phosphate synthase [Bacteroidales bacterium]